MKPIKILINRLGRVRNSEIEIKQMVLFSGESGLGKSYLAILVHYFFEVLVDTHRIGSFLKKMGLEYNREKLKGQGNAFTISKEHLQDWLAKDAIEYLGYMLNHKIEGDIVVELPHSFPESIVIDYEEQLTELVSEMETYIVLKTDNLTYKVKDNGTFEESPYAFLLRYELISLLFDDFKALKHTFVLPPSRGPILIEEIIPRTGLYKSYSYKLKYLEVAKRDKDVISEQQKMLINAILDGNIKRVENKYVYNNNGIEMPISAAAASVRELAPLELILENTNVGNDAILFEEPEAHLHPLKQRIVADVIASMHNVGAHMQITTHSDYFLRRINELLLLNSLKSQYEIDKYLSICNELNIHPNLALSKDNISAYLLKKCDNGSSCLYKQNLDYGIPFSSFSEAIKDSLKIYDTLENYTKDGSN